MIVARLILAILLVAANVHPWYLAWVLPLLAVEPMAAALLWVALMPIAYQVLIGYRLLGEWRGSTGWRWLIYAPVFALWAAGRLLKRSEEEA